MQFVEYKEVRSDYLEGMTIQQIAAKYGVSKSCITTVLYGDMHKRGANKKIEIIYPNIRKWMKSRSKTYTDVGKAVIEGAKFSNNVIRRKLVGERTSWTIPEIKNLLAYTGMSFDEAFKGEQE